VSEFPKIDNSNTCDNLNLFGLLMNKVTIPLLAPGEEPIIRYPIDAADLVEPETN
jgi:hypothetical protein